MPSSSVIVTFPMSISPAPALMQGKNMLFCKTTFPQHPQSPVPALMQAQNIVIPPSFRKIGTHFGKTFTTLLLV